jgi:Skp family chaperone for outer membrane proteins
VALAVLGLGYALGGAGAGRAVAQDAPILVVSRSRLLNDTAHARALLKAEIALTAELQRRVDMVKESLAAEEQELARLRSTLAREVFDTRVAEFDRLVRSQRRDSQRHASNLQNAFRAERLKLVEALGPLLEDVRAGYGASVILNADLTLIADPALDVTDEVIARFNASVPPPVIPDLDALAPAPEPEPEGEAPPE